MNPDAGAGKSRKTPPEFACRSPAGSRIEIPRERVHDTITEIRARIMHDHDSDLVGWPHPDFGIGRVKHGFSTGLITEAPHEKFAFFIAICNPSDVPWIVGDRLADEVPRGLYGVE